jgi:UDP-hydrolysing UDP-N-acetyl-D-glucosamine 2-epimerase
MIMPRRICTVLVDRANYGRMKPVMQELHDHPRVELLIVAAGTMVLRRFQRPVDVVQSDGFWVEGEIYTELEGSTPLTMAKSVGIGMIEFANEFQRLKPELVLVIGDRYEALAAAIAAAYMNIPLAHIQGGEVSGSIDESARHAISKFAQYHFPSTQRARDYLIRMGERPETILAVGCPSSDLARSLDLELDQDVINSSGSGAVLDVNQPFQLVVFHPTTTEIASVNEQMDELLSALETISQPTVLLWPNIDAGSDRISKAIRVFKDRTGGDWLRVLTNLSPEDYLRVLANASCAIGNSSSFVRDAGYFGTPVVLVGNRQSGREHDIHVLPASTSDQICRAVQRHMRHGRYSASSLYGDGHVAPKIAEALASVPLYVQKRLAYVEERLRRQAA